MKNLGAYIILLVVGLIVGYSFTFIFPNEIIIENTKIEYKNRYVEKKIYLDKPSKIRGVILPDDTITIPADTAELIERYKNLWYSYYSRNLYSDTLTFDTLGYAVVDQEVIMNRIDKMNYFYHINVYEKEITNTVINKHNLYAGLSLGYLKVAPTVLYNYKNKYSFGLDYNFLRKELSGSALININELIKYGKIFK